MTDRETGSKGRYTLIMVTLVFCAPLLLAWYVHSFTDFVETGGKANNGELVMPVRPLPALVLSNPGAVPDTDTLTGKWNLVFIHSGPCEELCKEYIYRMRQIRLAAGKHAHRLRRVLILDQRQDADFARSLRDYPGQRIYLADQAEGGEILALFDFTGTMTVRQKGWFYLVDPLGNLMMRYPSGIKPELIIKDLGRLLRTSRIG